MRYRTPMLIVLLVCVIAGLWAVFPTQAQDAGEQSWPDWRWWRWGTDKRYEVAEWLSATPTSHLVTWSPLPTPTAITRIPTSNFCGGVRDYVKLPCYAGPDAE